MRIYVWLAAILAFFGSAIYLLMNPDAQIPPLAEVLKDGLVFVLTIVATYMTAVAAAQQRANSRWIPQAHQACRGLLTVWANVKGFRGELSEMCGTLTSELKEMQGSRMQGVRTVMNTQCRTGAQTLDTIANHLDDSVAAWQAFIAANCEDDECEIISQELADRRLELVQQLAEGIQACTVSSEASGSQLESNETATATPDPNCDGGQRTVAK